MKTYIVGAGDFAREVFDTCTYQGIDISAFIDSNHHENSEVYCKTKNISNEQHFIETEPLCNIIIGVGNPITRMKIAEKYKRFIFPNIVHDKSIIMGKENNIGTGVIIQPGVIITNRVAISDFVVLNLNVTIGHDSHIGRCTNISPGTNINGHTVIGEYTNVGSNVSSVPGAVVGDNCVIGAGAVLRGTYPSNVLIMGVPGKVIREL
jgi:sugar O-acyltransferase (sialic acid O-acetyltransferase NeuD family)